MDRELLNTINDHIRIANDPLLSPVVRLESRILALVVIMQAQVVAIESLQRFYDDANIAPLIAAAAPTEPLDADGKMMKRSITKYLALLVSFRTWLTTPISAQVTETPRQLLARKPEKVAAVPLP